MTYLHIILNDKLEKEDIENEDLDTLQNQHLNMDIIERNRYLKI